MHAGIPPCLPQKQAPPSLQEQAPPPPEQAPTPWSRHPPRAGTPLEQAPPGAGTNPEQAFPPADGYCCGRYASYWNAFLFKIRLFIAGLRIFCERNKKYK